MSLYSKCKYLIYQKYLGYLRYRIYRITSVEDIIFLIKNINFLTKDLTSDKLTNILVDCLLKYPLSDTEIQKFSILQQYYQNELGIKNYVTFILWTSFIISFQEKNMVFTIQEG